MGNKFSRVCSCARGEDIKDSDKPKKKGSKSKSSSSASSNNKKNSQIPKITITDFGQSGDNSKEDSNELDHEEGITVELVESEHQEEKTNSENNSSHSNDIKEVEEIIAVKNDRSDNVEVNDSLVRFEVALNEKPASEKRIILELLSVDANYFRIQKLNIDCAGNDVSFFKIEWLNLPPFLSAPDTTDTMDPMVALEQRQEAILLKLGGLQATVQKLDEKMASSKTCVDDSIVKKDVKPLCSKKEAKISGTGKIPTSVKCKIETPFKKNVLMDIVINADCKKPPLSLFVIYELLKEKLKVFTTTYIHSSETSVPEKLLKIFQNGSNLTRKDHQLAVSLVWKKVKSGPTMMISPHCQTHISGECNIARYLWRLLHPEYDSADLIYAAQVDDWLDTAQNQILNGNNQDRTSAIKSMNSKLGKNEWLVGASLSVADIVIWSLIHVAGVQNEVPSNVKRWLSHCNNHAAFKVAKTLI